MDGVQKKRTEENEELIIIENPRPKKKPPVIVLCDSDEEEEEKKEVIFIDDSHVEPIIVDILSGSEDIGISDDDHSNSAKDDPIWSSNTFSNVSANSDPLPEYLSLEVAKPPTDSNRINELDKDKRFLKDWYEKFKTKDSASLLVKSSYTCPECRAELSTLNMIDRHIQSRHPTSIHRYQHSFNHNNAGLENDSCKDKDSIGTATTLQQRLRLNPLRNLNTISTGSATVLSTNKTNKNCQEAVKIAALPPLVKGRTTNHDICSNTKSTSSVTITTDKSKTPEQNNKKCQPLTVVIYSPNSEHSGANERFVQVNPQANDAQNMKNNKRRIKNTDCDDVPVIEISPCQERRSIVIGVSEIAKLNVAKTSAEPPPKRKRQDPLLLLTSDYDVDKQGLINKQPTKSKKKDIDGEITSNGIKKSYSCDTHHKTFATYGALLQHNHDKHKETTRNRLTRTSEKDSLRSSSEVRAFPSLTPTPPSMDKLKTMKHIIMIDLDNWRKIFESDLTFSPCTFVWGFHGGTTLWRPPVSSTLLKTLQTMNCFYLHPKCGRSKDAADFALCVQAGKLDALLPKEIIFTVLSGDTGFNELRNQLSLSKREVHIVNPHHKTIDTVLTILNSISDR